MLNESDAIKIRKLKSENPELNHLFTELEKEQQLTLSGVSHELRNILALILSSVQLIENTHPETKDYNYWNETMNDLYHMKNLLINFSDFNNGQKLDCADTNLYLLLEEIYHSMLPFFQRSGQILNFKASGPKPILYVDSTKLKQAVINLLKNASEAIKEGGEVNILYRCLSDQIEIAIEDNGKGMDQTQLNSLFKPFVTSKPSGTGLGLPLTKRIVEGHGGLLTVASAPGGGTIFTIELPLSALASGIESSPA